MLSSGRLLLANPGCYPHWRSVYVVLVKGSDTPADPTQLFLINSKGRDAIAGERAFVTEAITTQWNSLKRTEAAGTTPGGGSRTATRRGSSTLPGTPPHPPSSTNGDLSAFDGDDGGGGSGGGGDGGGGGVGDGDAGGGDAGSGDAGGGDEGGDDGRGIGFDGLGDFDDLLDSVDFCGARGGGSFGPSQSDAATSDVFGGNRLQSPGTGAALRAPVWSDGADAAGLRHILSSNCWKQSMENKGSVVRDSSRPSQSITRTMQNSFLAAAGLQHLVEVSYGMLEDIWLLATAVNKELCGAVGLPMRHWSRLCPKAIFENNWALEWSSPMTHPVADRTCMHPPRHSRIRASTTAKRLALVVAFSLSAFWSHVVKTYFVGGRKVPKSRTPPSAELVRGSGEGQGAVGGGQDNDEEVEEEDDEKQESASAGSDGGTPRGSESPLSGAGSDTAALASSLSALRRPVATLSRLPTVAGAAGPSAATEGGGRPLSVVDILALGRSALVSHDTPPGLGAGAGDNSGGGDSDGGDGDSGDGGGDGLGVHGGGGDGGDGDGGDRDGGFDEDGGEAELEPPVKKPRLGTGSVGGSGRPPRAPKTRIVALVGRASLGQARTGAPSRRPAAAAASAAPLNLHRSSPNPSSFSLTPIARAATAVTVTMLLRHWVVPPMLEDSDVQVEARVAAVREWATVVKTDIRILLSPMMVAQASLDADAFMQPGRTSARVAVARMERLVVQVTVNSGRQEGVHVLPRSAVKDMLIVHRANEDFRRGLQSKEWIVTLLHPGLMAPSPDAFLVPPATDLQDMVEAVRNAVGSAKLGDAVWERDVSEPIVHASGTMARRVVKHCLSVREVLEVARPVWMRCSFIDSVLVELTHYATVRGDSTHILLCDKFTALMRTGQNKSVPLATARGIAKRWSVAVGSSRSVLTLVNHKSHWCAARLDLDACKIYYYDPLPSAAGPDTSALFALSRLRLLGNSILAAQGDSAEADSTRQWVEEHVRSPTQSDTVSCGAFCLQFIICSVVGTTPELTGSDCDILRLALIHKMVRAGALLRREAQLDMEE